MKSRVTGMNRSGLSEASIDGSRDSSMIFLKQAYNNSCSPVDRVDESKQSSPPYPVKLRRNAVAGMTA
jgi:hypothetical protein